MVGKWIRKHRRRRKRPCRWCFLTLSLPIVCYGLLQFLIFFFFSSILWPTSQSDGVVFQLMLGELPAEEEVPPPTRNFFVQENSGEIFFYDGNKKFRVPSCTPCGKKFNLCPGEAAAPVGGEDSKYMINVHSVDELKKRKWRAIPRSRSPFDCAMFYGYFGMEEEVIKDIEGFEGFVVDKFYSQGNIYFVKDQTRFLVDSCTPCTPQPYTVCRPSNQNDINNIIMTMEIVSPNKQFNNTRISDEPFQCQQLFLKYLVTTADEVENLMPPVGSGNSSSSSPLSIEGFEGFVQDNFYSNGKIFFVKDQTRFHVNSCTPCGQEHFTICRPSQKDNDIQQNVIKTTEITYPNEQFNNTRISDEPFQCRQLFLRRYVFEGNEYKLNNDKKIDSKI